MPGLKCLLLRKVGKANLEHFEDLRRKLFNRLPHEFSAFRGILTFGNGSRKGDHELEDAPSRTAGSDGD